MERPDRARPSSLEGPRGGLRRLLHDRPRRRDRQRRAAVDPDRPRLLAQDLQWVLTAYAITFGGFLLLGGRAADLLGRRRVFLVGVVALHARLARSAASPSPTPPDRRARRPGPRRRDHLAGGALDRHDDLRGGRGAQQGARDLGRHRRLGRGGRRASRRRAHGSTRLGVDLLRQRPGRRRSPSSLTPRLVRESRAEGLERGFDVAGAVTVTGGLALLVYAHVAGARPRLELGQDDRAARRSRLLLLIAFVVDREPRAQTRCSARHLPHRTLTGANIVGFLLGATIFGNFFVLTLYVQHVLGYSAIRDGRRPSCPPRARPSRAPASRSTLTTKVGGSP